MSEAAPAPVAIHIAPSRSLVIAARVVVAVIVVGTISAAIVSLVAGDGVGVVVDVIGGTVVAVLTYDSSNRSVTSEGSELVVRQWFTTRRLSRDEIESFAPARGSFVRWDIVARRDDAPDVRLWVTRMITARKRTRLAWLEELEAWRTGRRLPSSHG